MKTLSFRDFQVGRSQDSLLIDVDSERDSVSLGPGLHLILAPNGFGKSTFFQTIAGVLPPLQGSAFLGEGRLQPENDVLYISEYLSFPKFIYPKEWVEFVAGAAPSSGLNEFIQSFSLSDKFESRFLGRMSQGERRKVTWLAAHESKASIILMDEPLDGLDLLSTEIARSMVQNWIDRGKIVLIVAHHAGDLLDLASDVYFITKKTLLSQEKALGQNYPSYQEFRKAMVRYYSSL